MADDSVPLPFPNLKVPQWHYQLTHIERLRDEATTSFSKAVEQDGKSAPAPAHTLGRPVLTLPEMAPYLRHVESDNADLIAKLEEKNKTTLDELEAKLKDAEENQGESEISELLRSKAMYYCRIGDRVGPSDLSNRVPR
jgi:26S proteasome regulatory subunit N7